MKRLGAGGRVCWSSNATSRCTPGEGRLSRLRLRLRFEGLAYHVCIYAELDPAWTGHQESSSQVTKPSHQECS